jgi:hypothetical protein
MKAISLILLTLFLGKSCSNGAQNDLTSAVLTYTANTRGFFQKITIQNQKIYISKNRNATDNGIEKSITDKDWKELVSYFSKIQLDNLSTYKDPTQKRFYDGAAIAHLNVKYKDKEYQTTDFDNGYPPLEIEKIVNKITDLAKENNE